MGITTKRTVRCKVQRRLPGGVAMNYRLVSLTALMSVGCGEPDDLPVGGAAEASLTASYCDPTPILETSCSGVICHGTAGKPAKYTTDLFNPPAGQTLGESLLGKPANYDLVADPKTCPTLDPEQLINPSAPDESLILKKIMGTQACGVKMPNLANRDWPPSDVDCFVGWVNSVIDDSSRR